VLVIGEDGSPSLGLKQIPSSVDLPNVLSELSFQGVNSLVQTTDYFKDENQFVRSEKLILDPAHAEFKFYGYVGDEDNIIYGCAKIGNREYIYSQVKKKWFATTPGSTLFMIKNSLSQVYFLHNMAVVNIYNVASREFQAGIQSKNSDEIAKALDLVQAIDMTKINKDHPAVLRAGPYSVIMNVDNRGMLTSIDTFDQSTKSSSVRNEIMQVPRISLPENKIIQGLPSALLDGSSMINDSRNVFKSNSSKGPTFGFAFAKVNNQISVTAVQPDSVAEKSGLKTNMIIVNVNGIRPADLDPKALMDFFSAQSKVAMTVKDGTTEKTVTMNKD